MICTMIISSKCLILSYFRSHKLNISYAVHIVLDSEEDKKSGLIISLGRKADMP